jgi:hypothetical protein
MSYAAGVIDGYKQVSDKSDELIDKEQVVIEEKQQPVDLSSEPFESFVVTLAETLKKQKETKKIEEVSVEESTLPVISVSEEVEPQEPFQTFISKLGSALEKEKKKKTGSIVKELKSFNKQVIKDIPVEEDKEESEVNLVEPKPQSSVSKYAEELAKDSKNEIKESDEEVKIKSIVSEQINKVRQLYPNIGASAGGGGTNAVQYANGGTMNGDLNVLGRYLSGGVDLAQVFSGSTGLTDRLISGSQTVILSSNGSLVFETTNGEAVLSNSNSIFNVKSLNTTETLLSGGLNLSELFLPKEEIIVDGGVY